MTPREVVQQAFVSAAQSIGTFAGASKVSTWLHRIVVNAALMKLRSQRRRLEKPIDELSARYGAMEHHLPGPVACEMSGDVLLGRLETHALVRRCIAQLPERYRTVLVLRDLEDLDTQETADRLAVTRTAVRVRLHHARRALRALLEWQFLLDASSRRSGER